jgi:hypothetical protein
MSVNARCGICDDTAYYSSGVHEKQPRCVRCHEVERSLRYYLSYQDGEVYVKKILEEMHDKSNQPDG